MDNCKEESLLCDFHIHTNYSDGSLNLRKVVDIYGQTGHDIIAITDHLVDKTNLMGMAAHTINASLSEENFEDYLENIAYESKRALDKYDMLVMPGVEITKNHISAAKSAHILLIDIKKYIPPELSYKKLFLEAKKQNALIIAAHPYHVLGLDKETLYLWNNRKYFSKYIDAWEIGCNKDLFNVVSLESYPFVANSDFHKPSHIHSWRTLLYCKKEIECVKKCIKDNTKVAIKFFRK
ncbi:MAG: PHP domain-containing protein [Desulfurella sp.]|uniref:PHP domain-containing protein n=1 Tax=Desulfurella sp. TaxID=1962857 RepID=UPI003C74FC1F